MIFLNRPQTNERGRLILGMYLFFSLHQKFLLMNIHSNNVLKLLVI